MRAALPLRRRLARDQRGVTAVEFGFVAPVLCLLLVGAFDMAHTLYVSAVLQGIVQKAARDSTLEINSTSAAGTVLDDKIRAQVRAVAGPNAEVTPVRRFYRSFTLAAAQTPEPIVDDLDHDGVCDVGTEQYWDNNNNNVRDMDGGDGGQGGAKDRTVYTVTVKYQHLLPIWKYINVPAQQTLSATTVLANQPYDEQGVYAPPTQKPCPTP